MPKPIKIALLLVLILGIYFVSSSGDTPYNYFTRLADAFLHGRYWLVENPSWLTELIPVTPNKYYVPYAPMPALVALPFVAIFSTRFPQQYIAHLAGAIIFILSLKLTQTQTKNKAIAVWTGLLTSLGTINWYMAATGSSWLLGQLVAELFLLAAIVNGLGKRQPLLMGSFLGAAYLARVHIILTVPFFLYLLWDKNKRQLIRNYLLMAIAMLPFLAFNAAYNLLRFGVPWDEGYLRIPGLFNEPWFQQGLFNLAYIPRHLQVIFTALPKLINNFPYLIPSWAGLAIWITTPAFVYSIFPPFKDKLALFSWAALLTVALVVFSHGSTGFAQFGYRFAVDFYPFLILLTLKGVIRSGLKWHHWALLFISILVNFWGVVWINKFGWVSF